MRNKITGGSMNKNFMYVAMGLIVFSGAYVASAQAASWGSTLGAATQAAGQAVVQQLCPQAQTTVDQAKKLAAGAPQENFIVAKAKEYLAAKNYQPAFDLANYVMTTLNSKSVDAKKIMADAKAALTKMAQDELTKTQPAQVTTAQQVQADAVQTVNSLKGLFGTTK